MLAAVALALAWVLPRPAAAQPSVEQLYTDAVAKERAVRAALSVAEPNQTALRAVRTVVREFEAIVRLHPNSGYCDDALWRAALTSLEAFTRLSDLHDRDDGIRLLRLLASEYPSSRFAKHVPGIVAEFSGPPVQPPVRAATASSPRAGSARTSPGTATITAIRRLVLPDVVRITIELDAEASFHDERLDGPPRVFVDFASTKAAAALRDRTLRFDDEAGIGRQIRIGRHPDATTRVVVDAPELSGYSVYPLYDPYRLVIECIRATPSAAAPLQSRPIQADWTGTIASLESVSGGLIRDALASVEAAQSAPLVALPPERNLAGGFSIARQLGLRVSRIVIDPGHGGHDPGAASRGFTEAELVLDVALRLEKLFSKVAGTDVVLTRRTDTYVPLGERTAIANREEADLFLSIHANASSNTRAQGVETYVLNFAQNLSAAAVAARENAASGQTMAALPELLKTIALNNKADESRDLASYVQRAMIAKLRGSNRAIKDLGVKQAPFMVLIGAAMPSVLAEVSFITNPAELKLLRQPAYRQRIADALFTAIQTYQASLRNATATSSQ
jgi:N-acetylmuramoyl-L-alanine amidase